MHSFQNRQLTLDLKERRVEMCSDLLEAIGTNYSFIFINLMTAMKSGRVLYDPETKNKSMEWRHTSSPKPKSPVISTESTHLY